MSSMAAGPALAHQPPPAEAGPDAAPPADTPDGQSPPAEPAPGEPPPVDEPKPSPEDPAPPAESPEDVRKSQRKAAAEALFQEGRVLLEAGQLAQACPKFIEAMKLDPTGGTMLNLALCHERQGKIASAWAEYREGARLVGAAGQSQRAAEAHERALALEARVSKLTIHVQRSVPGQIITRDGIAFGEGAFGVAVAVDPGEHVIEARAEGYEVWRGTVDVADHGAREVVVVPALVKEGAPPIIVTRQPSRRQADRPSPAADGPALTKVLGVALLGGGVASIGVGALLGVVAANDVREAESSEKLCGFDKQCTPEGQDRIDGAQAKADASTVTITLGAVLAAAGVVLVLLPSGSDGGVEAALAPELGPGRLGIGITGSF
jgi:hypothetical protein